LGRLFMAQWLVSIGCLAEGGTMIVKCFLPLSTNLMINLIYISTCLFESISLIKPETSHACNSEIYLHGSRFRGFPEKSTWTKLFKKYLSLEETTDIWVTIDPEFISWYNNQVSNLIKRQINSLKGAYFFYYHQDKMSIEADKNTILNRWLTRYPVPLLTDNNKL
jgi:hypothetical protein